MDQKLKIKVPKNSKSTKESYHHGNLYETLIQTAENLLRSKGLEAFSLGLVPKKQELLIVLQVTILKM